MRVQPASIGQVQRSRAGRMVYVEDDVANVAKDLHEFDPNLHLEFADAGGYWRVVHDDGIEAYLVLTAQECDQRIVHRVRELTGPGYDYVAELDRIEREAERAHEHRVSEQIGEVGERLAHALRKDFGEDQGRVFIPRGV